MHPFPVPKFLPIICAFVLTLLGGCADTPVAQTAAPKATFYPAPPLPPKLQFLTSYSGAQDLGGGPSKFATFVVGRQPVQKPILKPYGIATHGDKIYLCDTGAGAVDVLDLKTRDLRYFTSAGDGLLVTPVNAAVDDDGTLYVADPARGQVLVYGKDEAYQGAFGERINGVARAHTPQVAQTTAVVEVKDEMKPTDVALFGDRLYVTDLKTHCVRVFSKADRKQLYTIPRDPVGAEAKSRLYSPANLTVDSQGRVFVSDMGAFRVQQYAADGTYLRQFGQGGGDRPGEFSRPKGVAVDREGRLYVVDAATQVVQMFDAEGQLLLYFGEPQGEAPGMLDLPAKVAIDYEHVSQFASYAAPDFQIEYLVLVTSQVGDRKLSVFGFGHKK